MNGRAKWIKPRSVVVFKLSDGSIAMGIHADMTYDLFPNIILTVPSLRFYSANNFYKVVTPTR